MPKLTPMSDCLIFIRELSLSLPGGIPTVRLRLSGDYSGLVDRLASQAE